MNWSRYKQLADQADYFPAWLLTKTRQVLLAGQSDPESVIPQIDLALSAEPLPVPKDFSGDARSRLYFVSLSPAQAAYLVNLFAPTQSSAGAEGVAEIRNEQQKRPAPSPGRAGPDALLPEALLNERERRGFHGTWREHYNHVC